jgi:H+/Cl- antiporter ClcA
VKTRLVWFVQVALLGALVGVASGAAAAAFLLLLEAATNLRQAHLAIVYALPVAGIALGLVYERWGASIKGGSDLIIDTIHEHRVQIPLRMAPMVLVGTVLTHLFGGSAGREGTAVQMGASLADAIAHRFHLTKAMRQLLLVAGMAGGFGAVFGTPVAGAIFGVEVLAIGRLELRAIVPALVASFVGDVVTQRLGVVHTPYPQLAHVPITFSLLGELALIGVAMALAAISFVELTHHLKAFLQKLIPRLPIRMFIGGCVVVAMWRLVGSDDYLGLGVPMIVGSFHDPPVPWFAFAAKIVFTAVTLSAGFLGGEVTPLFFVGATLGAVLARLFGLPVELGAGVGIAAVFGAAANAPIALSIMAVELLGWNVMPHVFVVTAIAFLLAGHRGIYAAQRVVRTKVGARVHPAKTLRDYRAP